MTWRDRATVVTPTKLPGKTGGAYVNDIGAVSLNNEADVLKAIDPNNWRNRATPVSVPSEAAPVQAAQEPQIGKIEALGRGIFYGALQQPRDVAAAGYASLIGGVPFKEGLQQAKEMSLEGSQGAAQKERPGYFGGGQILGNVAMSAVPAAGATRLVGATAPVLSSVPVVGNALSKTAQSIGASKGILGTLGSGAVQGGVQTALTEGDLSGAGPGAIGSGVAGAAGKLLRPIGDDAISAARKGYVEILKKAGIDDLSPAQLTGNKNLELIDSVLAETFPTSGTARKTTEGQLKKFTQEAMKKAGIVADDFSPAVREQTEKLFGQKYKDLIKNEIVKIDDEALGRLVDIETKTLAKLPTNIRPVVESYLKDIVDTGGSLSGEAYQAARSQLSSQAKGLSLTDPFTANVLRDLRNTLDEAADRSLPAAKKGAWKELNKQYANYKVLQKAGSMISQDSLEGLISPSALNRAVETANRTKSQAGYSDLYSLSRAGRSVLADSVPNSGTAQRQLAQQLLTGSLGLTTGGITYGITQDPQTAVLAASGTLAGPKLAQYLLNTPAARTYFTKGIPGVANVVNPYTKQLAAQLAAGSQ